jgi:hypothetical protein
MILTNAKMIILLSVAIVVFNFNYTNLVAQQVPKEAYAAAHTQPLNANLKAYAAWHLWARLAGWTGQQIAPRYQGLIPDS